MVSGRVVLGVLAVSLFVTNVTWVLFLLIVPALPHQSTGNANAQAHFCINVPPSLAFGCNTTLSQDQAYYCTLNGTDVDAGQVLVYTSLVLEGVGPLFNVTSNGTLNLTPGNDDVGNYSVLFRVTDDSGCDNAQITEVVNFTVENVNDPPYLIQDIPDQEITVNVTLSPFFLTDYFADPDGDALVFTSSTPATVTVTILPSSEVRLFSSVCNEDGELVTFTATDPYNLSAESNVIDIQISCTPDTSGTSQGDRTGGGGGGGGSAQSCIPEWECQGWFACLPEGQQWRRCYDRNGCEIERYLKRSCAYEGPPVLCQENWLCSVWSECFANSTQYRSCKDLAGCGSTIVLPAQEQGCIYVPTCHDGIQNGNETGVDCGGACASCALVEQPSPIEDVGRASALFVFLIILAILIGSGVLRYYKSEIAQGIATLGFLLRHRAYKDILLTAAQRKELFERILAFETTLSSERGAAAFEDVAMLVRTAVHEMLGTDVEALPAEITARCKKLGLRPETTGMIEGLFGKLAILEQEELEYHGLFLQAIAEEVRTVVCLVSEYGQGEIARRIEELSPGEETSFIDEILMRMINIMRAVQFDQIDAAKKEYVHMLAVYDPLSEAEREQIYPELRWMFQTTKFADEITGARVIKKPEMV